jgi:hypothetical protein
MKCTPGQEFSRSCSRSGAGLPPAVRGLTKRPGTAAHLAGHLALAISLFLPGSQTGHMKQGHRCCQIASCRRSPLPAALPAAGGARGRSRRLYTHGLWPAPALALPLACPIGNMTLASPRSVIVAFEEEASSKTSAWRPLAATDGSLPTPFGRCCIDDSSAGFKQLSAQARAVYPTGCIPPPITPPKPRGCARVQHGHQQRAGASLHPQQPRCAGPEGQGAGSAAAGGAGSVPRRGGGRNRVGRNEEASPGHRRVSRSR